MSLSSMANIARQRATSRSEDPTISQNAVGATSAVRRTAAASRDQPVQTDNVTAALDVVMSYVPTEVLTLYIAVVAALQQDGYTEENGKIVFVSFLVATPVVMWLLFAAKMRAANAQASLLTLRDLPYWEMFAATVAFAAWALAMPQSPIAGYVRPGIASVLVLVTAFILGLLAPIFAPPAPSK